MLLVLKWNNTYNDLCSLIYQKGFLNPFLFCLNLYFAFVKAALVYVGIFLRKILYFFPFQLYTVTSLPSTKVLCLVILTLKNRGDKILEKKAEELALCCFFPQSWSCLIITFSIYLLGTYSTGYMCINLAKSFSIHDQSRPCILFLEDLTSSKMQFYSNQWLLWCLIEVPFLSSNVVIQKMEKIH